MMINHITCASKISTDLCFTKGKIKKNWFCKSCLQCFSNENVLTKYKEDCLSINGKPSAKVEEGKIEFEIISNNYQFHLKIMLILGVTLKVLKAMKVLTQSNIKITFLVVLLTKLFALIIGLLSQLLYWEIKILLYNLLKQFLKNISTAKM